MGCNGTGFSPAVSRWILTTFVRPQMKYGLGLTYLGTGFEKVINKARGNVEEGAIASSYYERTGYSQNDGSAGYGV